MTQPHAGPIRALVVDYGGVLTVPIRTTFDAWMASEGIDRPSFVDLVREWRDAEDNPMHQLETGTINGQVFAEQIVGRLRRADGAPVMPEGLIERMFAGLILDHDALVMLRAARAAGLRTALLSNSWDMTYPWADLDPLLDVKIISGDVGLRKPDPAIYQMASDQLGIPLDECAFVDDMPPNIAAAQELGMFAVLHTDLATTLVALAAGVPQLAPHLPHPPPVSAPPGGISPVGPDTGSAPAPGSAPEASGG
jgi:putative hydrolase of the HAD superfamily